MRRRSPRVTMTIQTTTTRRQLRELPSRPRLSRAKITSTAMSTVTSTTTKRLMVMRMKTLWQRVTARRSTPS